MAREPEQWTKVCAYTLLTGRLAPETRLQECRIGGSGGGFALCDGVYWMDLQGFESLRYVAVEMTKPFGG